MSALVGLTLGLVSGCDDGGTDDPMSSSNAAGGKADDVESPCYEGYDPKAPCQYDMECDDRGDCCPDLVDVCGSGEAQEFPGLPPSDDGSTSSGSETEEVELYGIVSIVPCSEITVQPEPVEYVSAVVNGPIDVTVSYPACGEGHEFVACYNQLPSYAADEYVVDLTVYPGDGPCDGEREARVLIHPAALFEDYLAETGVDTQSVRVRLWRFGWLDVGE